MTLAQDTHEALQHELRLVDAEQAEVETAWRELVQRTIAGGPKAMSTEAEAEAIGSRRESVRQRRLLLLAALEQASELAAEAEAEAAIAPLQQEYATLTGQWRDMALRLVNAEIEYLQAWAGVQRADVRIRQLRFRLRDKAEAAPADGTFDRREWNSLQSVRSDWLTSPARASEAAAKLREKRRKIFGTAEQETP